MKKPILIVSHDAGGAEVLSAWVSLHSENRYSFLLAGPAISIFSFRLGKIMNHTEMDMNDLMETSDFVLTSTSWSSDLEKKAIRCAKEKNIRVASYLDHWVHYPERFCLNDCMIMPDEIWVGDHYAKMIAKHAFPGQKIRYEKNAYFEEIEKRVIKIESKSTAPGVTILFLTQPLDAVRDYLKLHGKGISFTDRDVFDLLKKCIQSLLQKKKIDALRIRIHPSDDAEKYLVWMNELDGVDVSISDENDLLIDCLWADWVVGAFSTALVIGLLAKRKVFSCLPDESIRFLPHEEILSFKSYVKGLS